MAPPAFAASIEVVEHEPGGRKRTVSVGPDELRTVLERRFAEGVRPDEHTLREWKVVSPILSRDLEPQHRVEASHPAPASLRSPRRGAQDLPRAAAVEGAAAVLHHLRACGSCASVCLLGWRRGALKVRACCAVRTRQLADRCPCRLGSGVLLWIGCLKRMGMAAKRRPPLRWLGGFFEKCGCVWHRPFANSQLTESSKVLAS